MEKPDIHSPPGSTARHSNESPEPEAYGYRALLSPRHWTRSWKSNHRTITSISTSYHDPKYTVSTRAKPLSSSQSLYDFSEHSYPRAIRILKCRVHKFKLRSIMVASVRVTFELDPEDEDLEIETLIYWISCMAEGADVIPRESWIWSDSKVAYDVEQLLEHIRELNRSSSGISYAVMRP